MRNVTSRLTPSGNPGQATDLCNEYNTANLWIASHNAAQRCLHKSPRFWRGIPERTTSTTTFAMCPIVRPVRVVVAVVVVEKAGGGGGVRVPDLHLGTRQPSPQLLPESVGLSLSRV